jgi:hypothetical protein
MQFRKIIIIIIIIIIINNNKLWITAALPNVKTGGTYIYHCL